MAEGSSHADGVSAGGRHGIACMEKSGRTCGADGPFAHPAHDSSAVSAAARRRIRNPPLYEAIGIASQRLRIRPAQAALSLRRAVVENQFGQFEGVSQVTPHQVVYGLPRRSKAELLETGQYPRNLLIARPIPKNSLRLQLSTHQGPGNQHSCHTAVTCNAAQTPCGTGPDPGRPTRSGPSGSRRGGLPSPGGLARGRFTGLNSRNAFHRTRTESVRLFAGKGLSCL